SIVAISFSLHFVDDCLEKEGGHLRRKSSPHVARPRQDVMMHPFHMLARISLAVHASLLMTISGEAIASRGKTRDVPVPPPRPTLAEVVPDRVAIGAFVAAGLTPAKMDALGDALRIADRDGIAPPAGQFDETARKLIHWVALRSDDSDADFSQYAAFARDNPSWPGLNIFR